MLPSSQVAIFTRARVCYTLCASSHPEEIKKTMSLKECYFAWQLNAYVYLNVKLFDQYLLSKFQFVSFCFFSTDWKRISTDSVSDYSICHI